MSDRPRICVLTIRDGRDDVHEQSIKSLQENFPEPDEHIVIDDADHELGFSGAIQAGWEKVCELDVDYVFNHEADFLFNAPVPIDRMIRVLEQRPYLAQIVLKRQPVNEKEAEAGGIVEMWPDEYRQATDRGDVFSEHRLFWSTNPGVYSAAWCSQGWPQVGGSEMAWTDRLREDPDLRFAFWGGKFDTPRCEHIGYERAGHGY